MIRNAVVAALALLVHIAPAAADETVPCRRMQHEGARYVVCRAEPKKTLIRLAWKRPDGTPYALLSRLPKTDPATRGRLLFALNGGMFHADLRPVGLYVEQRRRHARINTRKGPGNFHLRPNGVFYIEGDRAGVLESRAYLRRKPRADYATQSGPMLVINGKLHPLFDRAEVSRKIRDGVGVDASGDVIFAIAEDPVSFASFGRLYRDKLKCPNALFLDGGSVPTLYAPAIGKSGNILPMGPMIAVYSR
ncbi:MAG: phosphodiester glycosidase family protein [Hyphomicrobiaceae bacterium]